MNATGVTPHQRLPQLRLDPVRWWAIGFSFQLAINQQSVCTSSAWLLPPGQGRFGERSTKVLNPECKPAATAFRVTLSFDLYFDMPTSQMKRKKHEQRMSLKMQRGCYKKLYRSPPTCVSPIPVHEERSAMPKLPGRVPP